MPQIQIDPANLATLKNHLQSYDEWAKDRDELSEEEGSGNYPSPDRWHDSDDEAVDLLRNIVHLIKEALGEET